MWKEKRCIQVHIPLTNDVVGVGDLLVGGCHVPAHLPVCVCLCVPCACPHACVGMPVCAMCVPTCLCIYCVCVCPCACVGMQSPVCNACCVMSHPCLEGPGLWVWQDLQRGSGLASAFSSGPEKIEGSCVGTQVRAVCHHCEWT